MFRIRGHSWLHFDNGSPPSPNGSTSSSVSKVFRLCWHPTCERSYCVWILAASSQVLELISWTAVFSTTVMLHEMHWHVRLIQVRDLTPDAEIVAKSIARHPGYGLRWQAYPQPCQGPTIRRMAFESRIIGPQGRGEIQLFLNEPLKDSERWTDVPGSERCSLFQVWTITE